MSLQKTHLPILINLKLQHKIQSPYKLVPLKSLIHLSFMINLQKKKHGFKGSGQITAQIELSDSIDSSLKVLNCFLTYQVCTQSYCLLPKTISFSHSTSTHKYAANPRQSKQRNRPCWAVRPVHESGWF